MRLGIVFALFSAVAWGQTLQIGYCADSLCYCMVWADDGVSGMGCGVKPFIGQAQNLGPQGFIAATSGPVPVQLASYSSAVHEAIREQPEVIWELLVESKLQWMLSEGTEVK